MAHMRTPSAAAYGGAFAWTHGEEWRRAPWVTRRRARRPHGAQDLTPARPPGRYTHTTSHRIHPVGHKQTQVAEAKSFSVGRPEARAWAAVEEIGSANSRPRPSLADECDALNPSKECREYANSMAELERSSPPRRRRATIKVQVSKLPRRCCVLVLGVARGNARRRRGRRRRRAAVLGIRPDVLGSQGRLGRRRGDQRFIRCAGGGAPGPRPGLCRRRVGEVPRVRRGDGVAREVARGDEVNRPSLSSSCVRVALSLSFPFMRRALATVCVRS